MKSKIGSRALAILLLCAMLFSLIPSAALAENDVLGSLSAVYLNLTSGADSNDGSESAPVKTFAAAKALLARDGVIYITNGATAANFGTGAETWSLPSDIYGDAKVIYAPTSTAISIASGKTVTLEDITIEGPADGRVMSVGLFLVSGGSLTLGEGTLIQNFNCSNANLPFINVSGNVTVTFDGAVIQNVVTSRGVMQFGRVSSGGVYLYPQVTFKQGKILTGDAADYPAYRNSAMSFQVYINDSLGMNTINMELNGDFESDSIYIVSSNSDRTVTLIVKAADGYKIADCEIGGEGELTDNGDGSYQYAVLVPAGSSGNLIENVKVSVEAAKTNAEYESGGIKVTAATDEHGAVEVDEDGVFTIKSAYYGYVIDEITIGATPVEDAHGLSEYIIDVSDWEAGDYEIAATFAYTLRYDVGLVEVLKDGAALLSGSIIRESDELTLRVLPNSYYDLTALTINGISILESLQDGEYTYTVGGFDETAKGGAEIAITVAVKSGVSSETITLDEITLSLTVGKIVQLTAAFIPSETANKAVIWTSSDSAVAAVSGDGKVFALGEGTATVTAAPMDGGASPVTCEVTVTAAEDSQDKLVLISDLDDFMAFAEQVNAGDSFSGKTVRLMADIDLSAVCGPAGTVDTAAVSWTPIGGDIVTDSFGALISGVPFSGLFDGNGHTVSGLYIYNITDTSDRTYKALFGYVKDGVIKDLTVEGGTGTNGYDVTAYSSVAGIAAAASGSAISGCVNTARVSASQTVAAGIASKAADGTVIVDCVNNAPVNVGSSTAAGGIVVTNDSDSSIINCLNAGAVSSRGTTGGIAHLNNGYIAGCVNTGAVSSASGTASGIAGNTGTIVNSYNRGAVTASANTSNNPVKAAGIAIGSTGIIENCYNTGKLSATGATGDAGKLTARCFAIAGTTSSTGAVSIPTVTNCYYAASITPTTGAAMDTTAGAAIDSLGSGGETDAELNALLLAALGDAYTADLAAPLNGGYPILTWQAENVGHAVTLTHNATEDHGLTVLAGGAEVQKDGFFNSGKGGTNLTLTMNKKYTVDSVTIGSGVVTPVSSEISGDTGTYSYLISGVSEETTLTVTLKEQDPDTGDPPKVDSDVSGSLVWDGVEVDVSWYLENPDAETYEIGTAAELAGVAALVNGLVNDDCVVYTPDGTYTAADWNGMIHDITDSNDADSRFTRVDGNFVFRVGGTTDSGGEGQNQSTDVYCYGIEDFNDKTIILTENLDMGGSYSYGSWTGPNYMPIGGQYLMTAGDTDTKLGSSFCGVFDGGGHYVYNIYCSRHAAGNYGDGQSVGFIGRLGAHDNDPTSMRPSGAGVYDLGVTGFIYANRSVGGIVGKIGRTAGGVTISGCVNYATVWNTDAKGLGGIVGAGWNGGKVIDCYNMGTIRSTYLNPTGGISGSNEISLANCYNVGSISAASSSYAMAIGTNNVGAPYSTAVTNCWYLDGSAPGGGYYSSGTAYNDGAMSAEAMKAEAFAAQLGDAYVADTNNINGGYPILQWQADQISVAPPQVVSVSPDGTGAPRNGSIVITFSESMDTAAAGTVTLNGKALTQTGVWSQDCTVYTVSYTGLKSGTMYTIGITGFANALGIAMEESVSRQFTTAYTVTVSTYPKRADVTVYDSEGNEVLPDEDGTYDLADGTYTYTATMSGYKDTTGSFTVENGALKGLETITLTANVDLSVFTDVNTSLWYKNAVEYSVANNLFTGTSATTWEPDTALSRAMFVTVLGKYEGVSNSDYATCEFNDVADGLWYTGFVQWAYNEGLVAGTGGGNFSPNDSITRQEMAVIFYKYAASKGCDMTASASAFSGFPDKDEADSWAVTALTWATDRGIINGSDGKLMPKETATRAQAAQIFMRIIEDIL